MWHSNLNLGHAQAAATHLRLTHPNASQQGLQALMLLPCQCDSALHVVQCIVHAARSRCKNQGTEHSAAAFSSSGMFALGVDASMLAFIEAC